MSKNHNTPTPHAADLETQLNQLAEQQLQAPDAIAGNVLESLPEQLPGGLLGGIPARFALTALIPLVLSFSMGFSLGWTNPEEIAAFDVEGSVLLERFEDFDNVDF